MADMGIIMHVSYVMPHAEDTDHSEENGME